MLQRTLHPELAHKNIKTLKYIKIFCLLLEHLHITWEVKLHEMTRLQFSVETMCVLTVDEWLVHVALELFVAPHLAASWLHGCLSEPVGSSVRWNCSTVQLQHTDESLLPHSVLPNNQKTMQFSSSILQFLHNHALLVYT